VAIDERMKKEMDSYIKRTKEVSELIQNIELAKTMEEVKVCVMAFISYSNANPKRKNQLGEELIELLLKVNQPFMNLDKKLKTNVVHIPPELAPAFMIQTCLPSATDEDAIYLGLEKFLERCDEYISPMEDKVTLREMNAVIKNAQKKFKLLDIIAPARPLKIVSLNNSHNVHNCECGITNSVINPEAVIFVYHPRDVSECDRVFIFAHEIGHALHIALTGDIEVIPEGFDEFNQTLDIEFQTLDQKREAFADVTAFAILNGGGLNQHLPHPFSEPMLGMFDKYIGSLKKEHLSDCPF
jgi:hypothetical protein